MLARFLLRASMMPITLVYMAYGRWWIDEDQCRRWVTAIMATTLWLARVKTDGDDAPREDRDDSARRD